MKGPKQKNPANLPGVLWDLHANINKINITILLHNIFVIILFSEIKSVD
mgnify:CR=1 FL=1|jgi:hypothetical protein